MSKCGFSMIPRGTVREFGVGNIGLLWVSDVIGPPTLVGVTECSVDSDVVALEVDGQRIERNTGEPFYTTGDDERCFLGRVARMVGTSKAWKLEYRT